jgi:hypothetical protein
MTCLTCNGEISEEFFLNLSRSVEFKGGRFQCPHCRAEHVRREVGRLPSGEPLYSIRRWGHLATRRHETPVGGPAGSDRRQAPRTKRWR